MAAEQKKQQPYRAKEPEQKALEINLDESIYGTFAEIGAGQEVARHFFQAGAAAGTIAKTMSAYDKTFSDEIYGTEVNGRYVCEPRLYKMLNHEYELLENRLENERPDTNFFVFADTVAAINFSRTIKGEGWLGVRFQLHPDARPNDLVIHTKMLDNDNRLQQQAIGILGVNLIYGVYRYYYDVEILLQSLMDNLRGRVSIDMIRLTGPDFKDLDNRRLSLWLIKHGLSDVAMFGPDKRNLHPSELLYKKSVLVVRGSFRPVTLVNEDMIRASWEQFRREKDVDPKKTILLTEITLDNLKLDGHLDEQDFLDRAELLNALGQSVLITNCEQHQKLIAYLSDFKIQKLGLVIGVKILLNTINEKYYANRDGSLLSAFGELFTRNVKVYAYPILQEGSEELITAQNLPVPDGVKFLYKHLIETGQIADIQNFHHNILHIYSSQVLRMIHHDDEGWDELVPEKVAKLVRQKYLFGFPAERLVFAY
jgi:hypothetical protein